LLPFNQPGFDRIGGAVKNNGQGRRNRTSRRRNRRRRMKGLILHLHPL